MARRRHRAERGALDQFTTDLTAQAKAGKIDPILGRDTEIRQIIDILTRRRQNNPILTGEAGVGKTAVVEGFALRIASGDVPPALQGVSLRTLDLGLLQAGAGVKGEFENRLRGVIDEVKASPKPIIVFIDEAHTAHRRRRFGGAGRCSQSAQAGAGTRRTAHDRRHHLGGIQEILREGRCADAALPGGEGGRAAGADGGRHGSRLGRYAGEAPQRSYSG